MCKYMNKCVQWRGQVACCFWQVCANRLCEHREIMFPLRVLLLPRRKGQKAGFGFGWVNLPIVWLYLESMWPHMWICQSSTLFIDEIIEDYIIHRHLAHNCLWPVCMTPYTAFKSYMLAAVFGRVCILLTVCIFTGIKSERTPKSKLQMGASDTFRLTLFHVSLWIYLETSLCLAPP